MARQLTEKLQKLLLISFAAISANPVTLEVADTECIRETSKSFGDPSVISIGRNGERIM
jgi:hypothetical protein